MAITKKQVLKTILMPGILPRLGQLFGSGFGTLAYLIAVVYNTVRILPNNHPFLQHDNIGTYGIRQVIAEAANHIKPDKKNIDQIIIFFTIIAALVILVIQFVLLVIAMIIPKAQAQVSMPIEIKDFFVTPNPQEDLAYRMLDLVFGIPDFFGSKEIVDTTLHKALHSLLEFYSYGMIIVGALIIIYFVVAIVGETAQSGTPFGHRFNKVWAPIRVILFFGLLIPISNGLNGGQYVTLASAKLGSSLASTGWVLFNDKISEENSTLTGNKESNVATPNYTDLSHLPAFMLVAKTCKVSYDTLYFPGHPGLKDGYPDSWKPSSEETGIQAWAVYKTTTDTTDDDGVTSVKWEDKAEKMDGTTFQNLAEKSKGNDISIVFGVKDTNLYKNARANIAPICGQLTLSVTDVSEPGSAVIHTAYYNLIKDMWAGTREINTFAENFAKRGLNVKDFTDPNANLPTDEYIKSWIAFLEEHMEKDEDGVIAKAVDAQIKQGNWQMPDEMKDYGWAGAGIWYNKIAQQNGALISALRMTPTTALYPRVMELTRAIKKQENKEVSFEDAFKPSFSAGAVEPEYRFPGEEQVASTLNTVYTFWQISEYKRNLKTTGNQFIDTINLVLGTSGLFEMCKNSNVHPLAQLSAVGKSMLDSSIMAMGFSLGGSMASMVLSGHLGVAAGAASKFFSTVASVGLLAGFILFYILPFMPFLYFFFAVGGWIKSIFEAVVAMPLWALAHLRIDGEGIPGEAAIGGYFLIFEIFIRPILIVVGLLAAISIFAGMVKILNEIFYLVVSNLSGHNPQSSSTDCFQPSSSITPEAAAANKADYEDAIRGPIDEFFFTILYTIVVYMIGTSCFKLIDMIPNNILRWINAEVPSFNDNAGDAAEGLMRYITIGGGQFGEQIGGSLSGLDSGAKASIQQFLGR